MNQMLRRARWALEPVLDRLGYQLARKTEGHISFLTRLLTDRLRADSTPIVFVQIGANDGMVSDPISPLIRTAPERFRGLVVEPLKDKFETLKQTYAAIPSVTPVNVAIHNTEKEMLLYRVRPELEARVPWGVGIGSFDPTHHTRSKIDASLIIAEKVACVTFDDLVSTYALPAVELVVSDTEGYDLEILRGLNLDRHRPTYIHFEHGLPHGMTTWERYKAALARLVTYGYSISHEPYDATAFLPEVLAHSSTSISSRSSGSNTSR